jgi:drug/metabolite transporter (DMT)-like permease
VGRRVVAAGLPVVFVLVWSSGYLAGSVGTRHGPPLALMWWRFAIALVVVVAVSVVTRAPWPRGAAAWGHLLVTGTLLQAVQLGGISLGLAAGVPAGVSALVLCACPLLVSAAAVPLFGERLVARQWVGLAVGLLGVSLSLGGDLGRGSRLGGYAFTVVALLGFAGGTLYQKRFGARVDLRTGTAVQLLGACAAGLPVALAHGGLRLPPTAPVLGSLAWLAVVNSIGAFALLFVLLRRRSGASATSLLYLTPAATSLLAVPLLGQALTGWVVAGMAVSGAGVLLVSTPGRVPGRRSPEPRTARPAER